MKAARKAASARRVVITRDEGAGGALALELARLGLAAEHWPVLRIGAPADPGPLRRALARLPAFDWIVFASVHAVAAVTTRVPEPRGASFPRVAAVGPSTARALRLAGWPVDVTAPEATAASLVSALAKQIAPGDDVLLPRSSRALPTLAAGLRRAAAVVHEVVAYVNEPAGLDVAACRRAMRDQHIGAVTFASPSAVEGLAEALGASVFDALLREVPAVAIGPTTASALHARRVQPALARPHTLRGLARAARTALLEASRT